MLMLMNYLLIHSIDVDGQLLWLTDNQFRRVVFMNNIISAIEEKGMEKFIIEREIIKLKTELLEKLIKTNVTEVCEFVTERIALFEICRQRNLESTDFAFEEYGEGYSFIIGKDEIIVADQYVQLMVEPLVVGDYQLFAVEEDEYLPESFGTRYLIPDYSKPLFDYAEALLSKRLSDDKFVDYLTKDFKDSKEFVRL